MNSVNDRYDEVFRIEIDGWCYGISNYQGEVTSAIIHRIIRELSASFLVAIQRKVVFDVAEIADKFSEASRRRVHEREIAFSILAQLPFRGQLDDESVPVLDIVIDMLEQSYPGSFEKFEKRGKPGAKLEAA